MLPVCDNGEPDSADGEYGLAAGAPGGGEGELGVLGRGGEEAGIGHAES